MMKNPLNSPCITFNFQNKLNFQSEQQCRQQALYPHKARYNKPLRTLLEWFKYSDWLYENKAVKNVKP